MRARHPRELRADMQRLYGINIDDIGASCPLLHAADLAAMLPRDSLCVQAEDESAQWGEAMYALRSIEYSLRVLAWQNTKDGHAGRNQPRPVETPAERALVRGRAEETDYREIAERLGVEL